MLNLFPENACAASKDFCAVYTYIVRKKTIAPNTLCVYERVGIAASFKIHRNNFAKKKGKISFLLGGHILQLIKIHSLKR